MQHKLSSSSLKEALTIVFELSNDGILLVKEDTVIAANQRFASICGYAAKDLPGMIVEKLLPGLVCGDQDSRSKSDENSTVGQSNLTLSVQAQNGKSVPVQISFGQFVDARKPWFLIFISDISCRQSSAEELQKSRQLESIAALSGGIAHDYNNLLTAIIGNISLIQSYVDEDDIIFRLLHEAHEASLVAKSLTQKLITFSRGGAPVKEPTDISALVKSATEFTLSGSNIKSQYQLSKDLCLADVDKTQIGQTIYNLVMNAREAMPDGGTLTVKAKNVELLNARDGLKSGRYILLSISDQGVGIPNQNLEKIFDPYFCMSARAGSSLRNLLLDHL